MSPILFGLGFGLAIFGGATLSRFDRDAERELRKKVAGDHPQISVRVRPGFESLWGKFPSANVEASDFSIETLPLAIEPTGSRYGEFRHLRLNLTRFTLHGLKVTSLRADIRHVRFDLGYANVHHGIRLTQTGTGPLTVVLDLSDVKTFCEKRFPEFKQLQIQPLPDGIRFSGEAQFGFFRSSFSVTGQPGVVDGTKLLLLNPRLTLNGKVVDAKSQDSFLKPFTPLLDLDKDLGANGAIHLDTVVLKSGKLVGKGVATIPKAAPES